MYLRCVRAAQDRNRESDVILTALGSVLQPAFRRPTAFKRLMELVTKLVILEVWALLFAAYSWLFIAERARSGPAKSSPARKLLLAAPAIAINLIAPLILNHDTEPLLITPAAGIFSLAGWKVGQGHARTRTPQLSQWAPELTARPCLSAGAP